MTLTWLLWRVFSTAMFLLFWLLLSWAGVAASARPAQQAATIPAEVEAAARAFVRELAEGRFAEAAGRFDENLTKAMPAHLFIAGSGPSSPAEYARPGHVADEVIADIAEWIAAQKPGS